jgi:hypothetical protein
MFIENDLIIQLWLMTFYIIELFQILACTLGGKTIASRTLSWRITLLEMDCEEGAGCSAVLKIQNKGNLPQLYRYHFRSSGIFSHFSWISRAQLIQLSPPHTPMLTIFKKRVKGYLKGYPSWAQAPMREPMVPPAIPQVHPNIPRHHRQHSQAARQPPFLVGSPHLNGGSSPIGGPINHQTCIDNING